MNINDFSIAGLAVIPIINGIVLSIKAAGLNGRWLPLTSLILGVLIVGGFNHFTTDSLLIGLIAGLSSTGLYEVGKTTVAGK